jgi:Na+-translocating ferredoxin:NAD+ oxidoreductase RNF subunit RnfB
MGYYPMPAAKPYSDADLVARARMFNHHDIADRLEALIYKDLCLCNIGVQACPVHPGNLRTKEEKISFRKRWDEDVERAAQAAHSRDNE